MPEYEMSYQFKNRIDAQLTKMQECIDFLTDRVDALALLQTLERPMFSNEPGESSKCQN